MNRSGIRVDKPSIPPGTGSLEYKRRNDHGLIRPSQTCSAFVAVAAVYTARSPAAIESR